MSFLYIPITLGNNIGIGQDVLFPGTPGNRNVAIGNFALSGNDAGIGTIGIGWNVANGGTVNYGVIIGDNADGGSNSVVIGAQAQAGQNSVVIGFEAALLGLVGNSVIIGNGAGKNSQNPTSNNTFVGPGAGSLMTSGSNKTIIGAFNGNQDGLNIITGNSPDIVISGGNGFPRIHVDGSGLFNLRCGTSTFNTPILNISGTWNSAVDNFGIRLNVTDTASGAASQLMDLQVGGVSRFSAAKNGSFSAGPSRAQIVWNYEGGSFSTTKWTAYLDSNAVTTQILGLGLNYIGLQSNESINWSNGFNVHGAGGNVFDLSILRDAANTLAQRNGVNAQTFRLYNTFTDASNYERGAISWIGNTLYIATERAGTGQARDIWVTSAGNLSLGYSSVNEFRLYSGATIIWKFTSSGNFVANADNTYDIGSTGANRPRNVFWAGYQEMSEMTAPAAPAANSVRIYAEDNGSGKTRLMARFATGAAQQIAIEP